MKPDLSFELSSHSRLRTVSVSSGKGGVGKTTIVSNMAFYLGSKGKKVLIFDGDLGMANVDIMFGIRPQRSLLDVVEGECNLEDILVQVAPNVMLVPGGSGIYQLQNLNGFQRQHIIDEVKQLNGLFDYLIIDTAPGISENVLQLNTAAQEILILLTPEPSSFADAYALIKVMNKKYRQSHFSIICNQVMNSEKGLMLFEKFHNVTDQFLNIGLDYWGAIIEDPQLRSANYQNRLILKHYPNSLGSRCLRDIFCKIEDGLNSNTYKGGVEFVFQHLVGVA